MRGPIPKPERQRRPRKPAGVVAAAEVQAPKLSTKAPADLGAPGRATWTALAGLEWAQTSDGVALRRLCELEDERATLRAALDKHGPMLEKPLVSPKGEVVGTEHYANPLIRELRRLDGQIVELLKGFGLTPMARARLGLAVIAAEKDREVVGRIMASYRRAAAEAER